MHYVNGNMAKSQSERSIELLQPAVQKFQARLADAVTQHETGWHRIAVKLELGQIKTVQIVLDETYSVDVKNRRS